MYVKQIRDFDQCSGEADIIVSDGIYELLCYCHPLESLDIGAQVVSISSLFAEDIMRVQSEEYRIQKSEGYYAYHLTGKIEDTKTPVVKIGDLKIILDHPLAKDIRQGEFVEFEVQRLDGKVEPSPSN
jgi:hypothetical protein